MPKIQKIRHNAPSPRQKPNQTLDPKKQAQQQNSEAWLGLRLTHLSLDTFKLSNIEAGFAVTYQHQIWQCNTPASNAGITPNMSISHALMLFPELRLQERDLHQEQKKLTQLGYWAYQFSSKVNLTNGDFILLEIGKSIKLFNNLNKLLNLINDDLNEFGFSYKTGLGLTPKAAYAVSFNPTRSNSLKNCQTTLQHTRLEHLNIEQRTIAQLQNCGFSKLADIQHIPRRELGQRFGSSLLNYLEQLEGTKADPQECITPPETFQACADFAEPIRNIAWIKQQVECLLKDLNHFLKTRQLICRSFTWRFYHEHKKQHHTVQISLSAKQNSLATFHELTELKLEKTQLNWEFSSIELRSTQLMPVKLFNDDLFDPKPDPEQFNQLIDRLRNRLGHTALLQVFKENEYLPELANGRKHTCEETHQPYHQDSLEEKETEYTEPFKDQPLWLLETPQRLRQQQRLPLHEGPLNIIHGPDRISSHWWETLQSRDYFIARQSNGRLLWIYFDRCHRQWYLHGLFA